MNQLIKNELSHKNAKPIVFIKNSEKLQPHLQQLHILRKAASEEGDDLKSQEAFFCLSTCQLSLHASIVRDSNYKYDPLSVVTALVYSYRPQHIFNLKAPTTRSSIISIRLAREGEEKIVQKIAINDICVPFSASNRPHKFCQLPLNSR